MEDNPTYTCTQSASEMFSIQGWRLSVNANDESVLTGDGQKFEQIQVGQLL